ncbi:glycogen debranching enzyme [Pochonia chlamydosporia 170]|uniref:Glycogen debranching enzyme n=1 Tax=Pochonia chlamydosporia 170 TaxID=1380566 RepID=A0A179EXB7_METCM|nr:glycogen debranching enzyme [Pochonia chlamydosporia 170]OAQ57579.1 glycogen debranching enzyme [Pochonia chlamydosporia 170]
MLLSLLSLPSLVSAQTNTSSQCIPRTLHLSDPPYENYFYSDCNTDAQVVVTSPLPDSNLSIIGPRLIVAWPAGNSGICTFFQPQKDKNGTLAVELVNSTYGEPLGAVNAKTNASSRYPSVGVQGILSFNNSAEIAVAILGSVRNIRDFTEGPSLLSPVIQDAVRVKKYNGTGVQLSRVWLDNVTTTTFTMVPWKNANNKISISNTTVTFGSGFYYFSTHFNYPQLKQLEPKQILNNQSQRLTKQDPRQVNSLSFFSYTEKLLAGGWRFLTYFGRDTLISALLLQPVLSTGNGSAMEAVIGAALERVNRTDGSVCHEETIGDYATFVNLQKNITSTAAGFTYPMIDSDYYLPITMDKYFQSESRRIKPLLATKAGVVNIDNKNLTWGQLAYISAQKIMNITAAFEKNQSVGNLIHLKDGEVVGQWRDSTYGIANARIPFDVNCALAPAALYSISRLAGMSGVYPNNSVTRNWVDVAAKRAKVWESDTLKFFQYNITLETARSRLSNYTKKSTFYKGPTNANSLGNYSSAGQIIDYGIAINSTSTPDVITISHTDTAFRHFLLNDTHDTQLTTFINASANAILRPFPAGLTTPFGAVVANPALSGQDVLVANFTNSAYHGTVIWSWQLALMAKGFERQLERCGGNSTSNSTSSASTPAFCRDKSVFGALKSAYNRLWDVIENNEEQLQSEVWSWTYSGAKNGTGGAYKFSPLGVLPPPPGVSGGTESDVRQLWSLTFLAVERNKKYR